MSEKKGGGSNYLNMRKRRANAARFKRMKEAGKLPLKPGEGKAHLDAMKALHGSAPPKRTAHEIITESENPFDPEEWNK